MSATLSGRERAIRRRLKDDLEHYAARCLKIRTKSGKIAPLILNTPQQRLHRALEDMRQRTGKVRMLIPKARQWGCSTYVEARAYHQVTHDFGRRAFILTPAQDSTEAVFEMAQRFHTHCPPLLRPHASRANARTLYFDRLDSGFEVGTAGAKTVGRGRTIQLFHGSEVAYWPNAESHMAGALEAVPDEAGTEIILESTANGVGGVFHDLCRAAIRKSGPYEMIFVPWFWHAGYRADMPEAWRAAEAWRAYARIHSLNNAQVYWAWRKNASLAQASGASEDEPCWLFMQEYPATVQEAFQNSGQAAFIRPELVLAARRNLVADQGHAPLILGVDIARGGGDKTRIIDRVGRAAGHNVDLTIDSDDLMEVSGLVGREIDRLNPDMTFIDVTGLGAGVVDRLKERGYRKLRGINFGGRALEPERFANKRAEMWGLMSEWFADPSGCDIPDDDALQADICAPTAKFDSNSRLVLERKEDIRKRLGHGFGSPDGGDALALTFAETVRKSANTKSRPAVAELASDPRRRRP